MSDDLVYADLNFTESNTHRLQKVTDVQDPSCHTDTINFKDGRRGKTCLFRTGVAVSVAVIILLVLAVCLILTYYPNASSPPDSKPLATTDEGVLGCPTSWEKNGKKCYYFFENSEVKDWNMSRKECADMNSDLVIIENQEELDYLTSKSNGHYYLLGLKYSTSEEKWKWFNNVEHSSGMFTIEGNCNYFCTVIGHTKVQTAPCDGSPTTQNMCEKAATI